MSPIPPMPDGPFVGHTPVHLAAGGASPATAMATPTSAPLPVPGTPLRQELDNLSHPASASPLQVGSRLSFFVDQWKEIGTSPVILN